MAQKTPLMGNVKPILTEHNKPSVPVIQTDEHEEADAKKFVFSEERHKK